MKKSNEFPIRLGDALSVLFVKEPIFDNNKLRIDDKGNPFMRLVGRCETGMICWLDKKATSSKCFVANGTTWLCEVMEIKKTTIVVKAIELLATSKDNQNKMKKELNKMKVRHETVA